MYNWYANQNLPILKTVRGVICTIGLPFWQPLACLPSHYFHHFNNPIFPTENLVEKKSPIEEILSLIFGLPVIIKKIYKNTSLYHEKVFKKFSRKIPCLDFWPFSQTNNIMWFKFNIIFFRNLHTSY